jgi:outer membrane lipase/esterase
VYLQLRNETRAIRLTKTSNKSFTGGDLVNRSAILCSSGLLLCGMAIQPAAAQSGGSVYAFGDSLTDNGNLPKYLGGLDYPAPPYYDNHFSNGPVFVEYLPALIGAGFQPSNDYGVGGAFAGDGNLVDLPGLPGTAQEIAAAAADGLRFTASDTVVLWAGSNNYFSVIGALPASATIAEPAVQASIKQVSGDIVSDAASLIGLGARRLVVFNVPDLGSTPAEIAAGQSVISTQISQANNAAMVPALNQLARQTGANIYLINAQLGMEEVLANPAAYGLKNTTSECILTPSCVNGSRAVQDTYLFWDDVHPTTGIHDYLAHVVANQLEAGETIGGEAELMIIQAQQFTNQLALRMDGLRFQPPTDGLLHAYIQGGYASGQRNSGAASDGFSYDTSSVVGGADLLVAPGIIVGAAGGYGQPGARYDNGAGKLGYAAYQGGVYAAAFTPIAYADLAGAFSGFDNTAGSRPGVMQGGGLRFRPQGHAWSLRGDAGLTLQAGSLTWGPVGGIEFTDAVVDSYSETGEPLLTQSVARQNVDSLVGRAGLQASLDLTVLGIPVRPRGLLEAEREFLDTRREVETSFLSAGLPVYDTLAGYTATYGRVGAGAAANVTRMITALVDFQAVFGRGNGEDRSVVLKVDAAF